MTSHCRGCTVFSHQHTLCIYGPEESASLALSALVPAGAVLQRRAQQRLVNQKQYREAKRLLKEFRARYRQLVRNSLRTVFTASPPPRPPTCRALSAGQPKLGRFLEFMDEFCQEPTASDSKE